MNFDPAILGDKHIPDCIAVIHFFLQNVFRLASVLVCPLGFCGERRRYSAQQVRIPLARKPTGRIVRLNLLFQNLFKQRRMA